MTDSTAIRLRGVQRLFDGGQGLRGLDLKVPACSIYGFLGPNGAGKTTAIRLMLGLMRPQAGTIEVLGRPVHAGQAGIADVGAIVDAPAHYQHLSGRENLMVHARLLGVPDVRIDELLAQLDLGAAADRAVRTYSLGMRQRLALAQALLARPRLLVLDEPANGLDPQGMVELRAFLRKLVAEDGVTVFLSSHLLDDVAKLATHVGLLVKGRLALQGSLPDLMQERLAIDCDDADRAADLLAATGHHVERVATDRLILVDTTVDPIALNRQLVDSGIGVARLARERGSLEALFLGHTETSSC